MTRKKKTKSAASGNGAAAVSALGQSASAGFSQDDSASGSDVTLHNEPTCPYTGYSLLGPRPVYPVIARRPVTTAVPRPAHPLQGPRPMHPSPTHRPVYPVTSPHPVTASSGLHPVQPRQASRHDHKASSGPHPVKTAVGSGPHNHSVVNASSSGSSAQSEVASSAISVSSTNTLDSKDNKPKKKPKQKYKVKVTYETKQIHIYPRQPILMVERLKELEHHVGVLTEAVGRRPTVYPHGRGVRFVPETEIEYVTIQRYLARIEAQERIAWCSYSVPPGNSLKVNVKVRVVERTKITDDLTKLKLQDDNTEDPFEKMQKDFDVKGAVISKQNGTKAANSTSREKSNATLSGVVKNNNNNKYQNDAAVNTISTSSSGQFDSKNKEKQQAEAKVKLVSATGAVQQSNKKNVNTVGSNKSAMKPRQVGPGDNKPKKKTETDETMPALKTEHNERDNKLRIVGVVRTNKMF